MPKTGSNETYLILSQSGRMLAQSAFAADIPVVVIDQFGDLDTHRYCKAVITPGDFSDDSIFCAIKEAWQTYHCAGLILGSGFEDRTDLISKLEACWPVYGNRAEVIKSAKDPVHLSDLLTRFNISSPPVCSAPPENGRWLVKQKGACGGHHVSGFDHNKTYPETHYFQMYQEGKSLSVIILANGKEAQIVGYNQCWTENDASFRFGGAVAIRDFSQHKKVVSIVNKISRSLKLIGLCGLDFILDKDDQINVLEINPRPVATLDLHDTKPVNLFSAHLASCRGELNDISTAGGLYCAKSIVYAKNSVVVPDIEWPEWVADIPHTSQNIRENEPICTVYSEAENADNAIKLVHNRHQIIKQKIYKQRELKK